MRRDPNNYAQEVLIGSSIDLVKPIGDVIDLDELNSKILETAEPKPLTYLGSGSTAICYSTEDNRIVKEFFPESINGKMLIRNKRGRINAVDFSNDTLISDTDKNIFKERYRLFCAAGVQGGMIEQIERKYGDRNITYINAPELVATSIGYCYYSQLTHGGTVETCLSFLNECKLIDRKKFLAKALKLVKLILEDLVFYHSGKNAYLNCDIKPSNLLMVKTSQDNYCVRNLDFGSCISVDDFIRHIEERKDEFKINEENDDEFEDNTNEVLNQFINEFIFSTKDYYSRYDIEAAITECCKTEDYEEKVNSLKSLDVKAVLKIFGQILCDHVDFDDPVTDVKKAMAKLLGDDFTFNSFADYELYAQIVEIFVDCFDKKPFECLSSEELLKRVNSILFFFDANSNTLERVYYELLGLFSEEYLKNGVTFRIDPKESKSSIDLIREYDFITRRKASFKEYYLFTLLKDLKETDKEDTIKKIIYVIENIKDDDLSGGGFREKLYTHNLGDFDDTVLREHKDELLRANEKKEGDLTVGDMVNYAERHLGGLVPASEYIEKLLIE